MLRRRKVGPAYTKSPLQKLSEWASRNFLILLSAVASSVVYWFMVNFLVDKIFNFLATGGNEEMEEPFSSNADLWIVAKLVGSLVITVLIIKAKAK